MSQVRLAYSALDTSDLRAYSELHASDRREALLAEVLVLVDADLQIVDGERVIYEEPSFPVLELARSLRRWVTEDDHAEFLFESMSFEEVGSVIVIRREAGGCSARYSRPASGLGPSPGPSSRRAWVCWCRG